MLNRGQIDFIQPKKKPVRKKSSGQAKNIPDRTREISIPNDQIRVNRAISPREEAKAEVEKTAEQVALEAPGKVDSLIIKSNQVLMHLKVANPLDFWPDEITINTNQVNVITRQFFATEQIRSLLIKDISDVIVETSLFFATLKILDVNYQDRPVIMKYLKRDEAVRARRIIQGLRVSLDLGIDYTQFKPQELVDKMEQIGLAQEVE